uniref:hypothetical protein n=1 Tax=Pedobacter schmidteae TaxID=2201271 RepID=UPI000EABD97D|nr:hypothetical protein [Pedobacter schmidteae]
MRVDITLLKRIHEEISLERTGCPDLFAKRLGISRRLLYVDLEYLKSEFAAPIAYSRIRETFFYTDEYEFYVGDLISIKIDLMKVVLASIGRAKKR